MRPSISIYNNEMLINPRMDEVAEIRVRYCSDMMSMTLLLASEYHDDGGKQAYEILSWLEEKQIQAVVLKIDAEIEPAYRISVLCSPATFPKIFKKLLTCIYTHRMNSNPQTAFFYKDVLSDRNFFYDLYQKMEDFFNCCMHKIPELSSIERINNFIFSKS